MPRKLIAAVLALTLSTLFVFAQDDSEPTASVWDGVYTEEQAQKGKDNYAQHCAGCHAPDLGGTPGGPALKGARFIFGWNDKSVAELYEYTSTMMPLGQAGSLSSEAYAAVVAHILEANDFPAGDEELLPDTDLLSNILIEREG